MAIRYRDTETGKFVKQSTFNRSRAHGGTRYIETEVATATRKKKPDEPEDYGFYDEDIWEVWAITFSYGEDE